MRPFNLAPQCMIAIRLSRQPERSQQGELRPAVWCFATHRARPQVSDGRRAVYVLRVEIRQFLSRGFLELRAGFAQIIGQSWASAGNVLKQHLEDQAGDRIQVAGKGLAAQSQRLQGDRPAAGEWVYHQWRFFPPPPSTVRGLHKSAAHAEIVGMGGQVPIGEVRDEAQQCASQAHIVRPRIAVRNRRKQPACLRLERLRAVSVARIRPKQREQDRPAGGQWSPRPPMVHRGRETSRDREPLFPNRVS